MKKIIICVLSAICSMSLNAEALETLVLNNGDRVTGHIVRQNIDDNIIIEITDGEDGTVTIPLAKVLRIDYLEEVERGSDKYYVDVWMKEPEGKKYSRVLLIEKNYDNIIFSKGKADTHPRRAISLSDIAKLERQYDPKKEGLLDELQLQDGTRITGQITQQVYGNSMTITDATGSHTYSLDDIMAQRKIRSDINKSYFDQADKLDEVRFQDGTTQVGVITEQDWQNGTLKLLTPSDIFNEYNLSDIVSISKKDK